ncbi:MAG: hypothetical protein C0469_00360 [Cyanobacteria bacterium DS2.3.42]|nr:hypothetical protein [Cyanobacteria bacterium DS2.3.42]
MPLSPALTLALILLGCSPIFMERSFAAKTSAQTKILEFPDQPYYGTLSKVTKIIPLEIRVEKVPLGQARAKVRIAAKTIVLYEPGPRFFQNPQILFKLAPDSIQFIKMQFTSMDEKEYPLSDRAVPYLNHLKGLVGIDFDKSDTTDAGAEKLKDLPNLQALSAMGTGITGTCIKSFATFPKLKFLKIGSTEINNASLRYLHDLASLRKLVVNRAKVNAVGMQHIAACPNLTHLDVSFNAEVDDKGLELIKPLKNLQVINLRGTSVSARAIRNFSKSKTLWLTTPKLAKQYSKQELDELRKTSYHLHFDAEPKSPKVNADYVF